MENTSEWETTEVIICGCGPTGASLSALLGQLSVPNVVLEKDAGITTDPRGITLDEDGLRIMQRLGLYEYLYSEIGECTGKFFFLSGRGHDLHVKPFMQLDHTTSEGGTGHVGYIFQRQPLLEHYLRIAGQRTGVAEIRSSSRLTSITEDQNWVYITYQQGDSDAEHKLRAKFLVGADGKTGFVRKKYLEAKGVVLERSSATPYEEAWVAINFKLSLPTPTTHPDFPLWKLGYSPQDVYDEFFPRNFRFIGNPDRPSVCGRFGLSREMLWRFEYVLLKDEDGQDMARQENVERIVFPYLTHAGKRYKLSGDVQYPKDCIEILRASPFTFSAKSANKWALGRVILCGDAAHVFPPYGGQGIVSGMRDANSLVWRLAMACRPGFTNYENLFRIWYTERKQQLDKSIAVTVANGNAVTESDPFKIFVRDWSLWFLQLIPSQRRSIEQGDRGKGMFRYAYEDGFAFSPSLRGGFYFPQVYCVPLGAGSERPEVKFTDDIIYERSKHCLFQLVILIDELDTLQEVKDSLSDIDQLSENEIDASEATVILQQTSAELALPSVGGFNNIYRVATAEEFAASPLCEGRPEPKYYDPFQLRKEARGKRFVILRPDFFVFAVCADKEELDTAAMNIPRLIKGLALQGKQQAEPARAYL